MTCHEIEKYSVHGESIGAKEDGWIEYFTISIITVCIHTPYLVFFFYALPFYYPNRKKLLPKI